MLDYALQLTVAPAIVTADHIAALRDARFDDRAIHGICAIAACYAFVNRMADGLGVELEPRWGREATKPPLKTRKRANPAG